MKDFHKAGYYLAIKNAENLFEIGLLSYSKSLYGHACALNILAAEEAVKAIFILIPHYYPNAKINNYEAIFTKHSVKHKELREFITQHKKLRAEIISQIGIFENILKLAEVFILDPKTNIEHQSIISDLEWYKKQSTIDFDLESATKWLKKADNTKNDGFYVSNKNNKWATPADISKEKYELEKQHSSTFIKYAKSIEEWFERSAKISKLNT